MIAKKLTIGIFAHREPSFVNKQMSELVEIRGSLLSQVNVSILATGLSRNPRSLKRLASAGRFLSIASALRASGVSSSVRVFGDYWSKSVSLSQENTPLILKLDEDVFLSSQAWEALLEAAISEGDSLEDLMSVALSTGIPTVENFIDNFLSVSQARRLRELFSQTMIPSMWGMDYEPLKGTYRIGDPGYFWGRVQQLEGPYKGIHPVRVAALAQKELIQFILSDPSFLWNVDAGPRTVFSSEQYFCNSLYVTATSVLADLVNSVRAGTVRFDGFDELPLNDLRRARGLRLNVLSGIPAVHPSYNTIGPEYRSLARHFFRRMRRI